MGAPSKHGAEERSRTYFDQLTISSGTGVSGEITVTLSLAGVVVEGEGRDIIPVNEEGSVTRQGVTVTVDHHQSCWIGLGRGVQFLVLFHQYKQPSYLQMAHLGFYIADGRGLSATTQGLLGMKTLQPFIKAIIFDLLIVFMLILCQECNFANSSQNGIVFIFIELD